VTKRVATRLLKGQAIAEYPKNRVTRGNETPAFQVDARNWNSLFSVPRFKTLATRAWFTSRNRAM
jgi:hypothetical protein